MKKYYFETREFGVSDDGIHLLRSRFNYETIAYSEVDNVVIERGKELNNWHVILIIGLALVSFSVYYSVRLVSVIVNHEVNVISDAEILIPLIPLMFGGYCLYSSTKNGIILRVMTVKNKRDKFPLRDLVADEKGGTISGVFEGKADCKSQDKYLMYYRFTFKMKP